MFITCNSRFIAIATRQWDGFTTDSGEEVKAGQRITGYFLTEDGSVVDCRLDPGQTNSLANVKFGDVVRTSLEIKSGTGSNLRYKLLSVSMPQPAKAS